MYALTARDALRVAAADPAGGAPGAPDLIFESEDRQVIHTDRTSPTDWTSEGLAAAFVNVYAEHFFLSTVHAMVRSASGFSASAQAWGRVPLALVLDVPRGACIDASGEPGEAAAAAATAASAALAAAL